MRRQENSRDSLSEVTIAPAAKNERGYAPDARTVEW
jgi:hypothetical protein